MTVFFCLAFLAIGLFVQNISNELIAVGNKPHEPNEKNGLIGVFGYFASIFGLPLYLLSFMFAILSIRYIFKLRNSNQLPVTSKKQIVAPDSTKTIV